MAKANAKKKRSSKKTIKYGVLGLGRGTSFMNEEAVAAGFELVAVCDIKQQAVADFAKSRGISAYTDFDAFLEHDMDAVVLANYFHQHAPYAIKALKAGKHVMSECAACSTLGEGVELIRAVEKSGKTYMFAENYPYMPARQEMRRVFQKGDLGSFVYGEGEYVHPMDGDVGNIIAPGIRHWRNWNPATYYCTHALAPVMFITDTWPEKVNGFVMRMPQDDPRTSVVTRINDASSMIALRMNNGAVVKLLQVYLRGHGGPTRIHCARGAMTDANGQVNIIREQFHEKQRHPVNLSYSPDLLKVDPKAEAIARRSGHGGGDFWMMYYFGEAIRTGQQPYLDVYRGVAMSAVGIQAWRSALNDSNTFEIPDFRKEANRRKYAKDDWTADPDRRKPGQPPSNLDGITECNPAALKRAAKQWKKMGYTEDVWRQMGYSEADIAKMTVK